MREIDGRQQNRGAFLNLDSIGLFAYVIGLLSSLFGFRSQGALIGAVGLGLVIIFYLKSPLNDLLALDYRKQERVNIGLAVVFVVFLFARWASIVVFCIGALFFLHGCVSLKGRKIYIGSAWRLEDRTCYTQATHPFRYWLWTLFYLSIGVFLLVYLLLTNLWIISEMRRD
ncbi:MAG TPA: hypothetical protein VJZ77_02610 [Blastocatellia bacterium]|nr:hypothetical protein [Blastocatellia bacterium]